MNLLTKPLLATLCAASLASIGHAATVRVTFDTPVFHASGADTGVTVKYPGGSSGVNVGMFSASVSQLNGVAPSVFISTSDFVAYCYDLYETISPGLQVTYQTNLQGGTARTLDFLGAVNHQLSLDRGVYDPYAWLRPTTSSMGAAIQLGIWESLYETSGVWSNTQGTFQATAGVDSGTSRWLDTFYAALGPSQALDSRYVMTLEATGAQDLITGEVPEPASLALVGLALAGLVAARRRRV